MMNLKPLSEQVCVNSLRMHYVQWANEGEPVLLIHGLSANCRYWDGVVDPLLPSSYRFIAPDLRGRGNSEKPNNGYSLSIHAADLIGLLNVLQLPMVTIIGHSLGAMIGIYMASHFPERVKKLVLVDGGGSCQTAEQSHEFLRDAREKADLEFSSLEEYYAYYKEKTNYRSWTPAIQNYLSFDACYASYGKVKSKVMKKAVLEELRNLSLDYHPKAWLRAINCPTLLLRATDSNVEEGDQLINRQMAEKIVSAIPYATFRDVDNTNHFTIMLDESSQRDHYIQQFLDKEAFT